jgi:23S rRNA G2445 N2-methylase RlmL
MDNNNTVHSDKTNPLANSSEPGQKEWIYLAGVPGGLEDYVQEELTQKCKNLKFEWIGFGAIKFLSTSPPQELLKTLRSINRLYAYIHHWVIDPPVREQQLKQVEQIPYNVPWTDAFEMWRLFNQNKPDPATANENLLFRVTCERTGQGHKITSMDAAAIFGANCNDIYHWKPKMKGYDMEIYMEMRDEQGWAGICLTEERQGVRNRSENAKTVLMASMSYIMARIANIKSGDVVVDPMGGVASIPLEASSVWPDAIYISGEYDTESCQKAAIHIDQFGKNRNITCLNWDATRIPMKSNSADIFICDLPFGRRHGSNRENQKLYPRYFEESARVIRAGGISVLVTLERKLMERLFENHLYWDVLHHRMCDVGGYKCVLYVLQRKQKVPSTRKFLQDRYNRNNNNINTISTTTTDNTNTEKMEE